MNREDANCFVEGLDPFWLPTLVKQHITMPTEMQSIVIPRILRGESVIFQSETGTGKTFAYILPLLQKLALEKRAPGRLAIIAPTLELCAQIKNVIDLLIQECRLNLKALLLIGGANKTRQQDELRRLKPDIIVGNAKRMLELHTERALVLSHIHTLVLDEADRLVAPELICDIQTLVSRLPQDRLNIACSATITGRTHKKIADMLQIDMLFLKTSGNEIIKNRIAHWALYYRHYQMESFWNAIATALRTKKKIVFASDSKMVNKITAQLQRNRAGVRTLYSGQRKDERKRALDDFRAGTVKTLVTTDLCARGLDIPSVKYVICAGIPESVDTYIHRAGRTARRGNNGICIATGDETDFHNLAGIQRKLGFSVEFRILENGHIYPAEPVPSGLPTDQSGLSMR